MTNLLFIIIILNNHTLILFPVGKTSFSILSILNYAPPLYSGNLKLIFIEILICKRTLLYLLEWGGFMNKFVQFTTLKILGKFDAFVSLSSSPFSFFFFLYSKRNCSPICHTYDTLSHSRYCIIKFKRKCM